MNEIWKDINNYEGIYQISNLGNVRSLDREQIDINGVKRVFKGQMLTKSLGNWGYYTVSLKKNSQSKKFFVHRLVAQEFIPNPNNLEVVNHKDGNKLNNISDNLEWISLRDNTLYSQHSNKKKILQYSKSGEFIKIWDSITEAAKYFQVNVSLISQCLSNKISSAANYVWRYYYENFPEKIDTNGLNFSKKYCYQYDLEGNFIKEWKTRSQAEKELNIASGNISQACIGTLSSAGGYQWRNTYFNKIDPYKKRIRKINQYDLNENFIKTWDNSRQASLSLGMRDGNQILLCCKGKSKTCKGYIWRYAE